MIGGRNLQPGRKASPLKKKHRKGSMIIRGQPNKRQPTTQQKLNRRNDEHNSGLKQKTPTCQRALLRYMHAHGSVVLSQLCGQKKGGKKKRLSDPVSLLRTLKPIWPSLFFMAPSHTPPHTLHGEDHPLRCSAFLAFFFSRPLTLSDQNSKKRKKKTLFFILRILLLPLGHVEEKVFSLPVIKLFFFQSFFIVYRYGCPI